jgi:hypothetical protein
VTIPGDVLVVDANQVATTKLLEVEGSGASAGPIDANDPLVAATYVAKVDP